MKYFLFRLALFSSLLMLNLAVTMFIGHTFFHLQESHTFIKYLWMIPFYLFAYYAYKLLSRRMVTTNEVTLILKANVISLIAIFFTIAIGKLGDQTSRIFILIFFVLNTFNFIWAYLLKKFFFQYAYFRRPVFVICDTHALKNIRAWFSRGNPFGYDIHYVLNVDEQTPYDVYQQIDTLVHEDAYDSVVIDLEDNVQFQVSSLVDHLQPKVRRIIILPKMSKIPMLNGELISSLHHKGMAFYMRNNLLSPFDRALKQAFDIIVACLLIIVSSPFLIALYLIVFISTKGHPIFAHKRIGCHGKSFKVYKFRTMHLDANKRLQELLATSKESKQEWEKDFKLKNDPRITKIGKFLRKTSLDELPQLINVIKGEMSLVGPRPITQDEVKKYGEYFEYFTAVRPGVTGLWQVSGRNDVDYDERVQLDVWYVRNWSVELDIQILLKTVLVVLGRKGSY